MDALLELLSASGYEIKRGKNITLMKAGQKNIRLNSLGEGYTEKELFAVISGAKVHTPRKNRRLTAPKKAKLITEIEDKLNGRHSQWDSVRILKQMAQSVLYVQQHDFDTFDELAKKSAAASARVGELGATIKSAEKRMAEIAALRTHIIGYAKTREVYAGYRKAGYSKKYLAAHEDDIIIHKAAKRAFDEAGLKKLPTVKSLNVDTLNFWHRRKRPMPSTLRQKKRCGICLSTRPMSSISWAWRNRRKRESKRPSARARGKIAPERCVAADANLRNRGLGAGATNKQIGDFCSGRNP